MKQQFFKIARSTRIRERILTPLSIGVVLLTGCEKSTLKPIAELEQQFQSPFEPQEIEIRVAELLNAKPSDFAPSEHTEPTKPNSPAITLVSDNSERVEDRTSNQSILREIVRLRGAAPTKVRELDPKQAGQYIEVDLTQEEIEQDRLRRLEQTIPLAKQVLTRTQQDEKHRDAFLTALQFLLDARATLVQSGNMEQAQKLAEDADAFYQYDPTSFAATESAARLVSTAQALVRKSSGNDSKIVQIYAREARKFALNFPQDSTRGAVMLIHSASLCEDLQLFEDAEVNYALVEQSMADTPFADQVSAPLRRLRLSGSELTEFGGPSLSGEFIDSESFKGRTTIVAFWSSDSAEFQKHLPILEAALQKHGEKLQVIGVNFDTQESAVSEFVKAHNIKWKSIFSAEESLRGSNNLIARYYDVNQIPSYWLVDGQGVVRSIQLDLNSIDSAVESLITK